jgi:hypothetical protein
MSNHDGDLDCDYESGGPWPETPDEKPLAEEPAPASIEKQLTANLQSAWDTLYLVLAERDALQKNLAAVQERCTALMNENRALKKALDEKAAQNENR